MDGNLVAETVLSDSDEGMIGSFYLSTHVFKNLLSRICKFYYFFCTTE